jgi:DNA polymerase III alpha subunit (gram-positive type)
MDEIKTDEFLEFFEENKDRVWIFLDTETLGLNPQKHQLTEVAVKALKVAEGSYQEISHYHEKIKLLSVTRLRLGMPFRGKGLSYRDIMKMTNYGEPIGGRDYVEEKQVLTELLAFIANFEDPIIVAHNAPFDMRYLNGRYSAYYPNERPFDEYEVLDTLKVMRKYFTALIATESKRFNHRWLTDSEKQHILEMRKIRKSLQKKKKKRMSLRLGNVANSLGIDSSGWHSARFDVDTLISTTEHMIKLFIENSGKSLYPEKYFL